MIRRGDQVYVPKPPFPENIMIELSNACNHACVFCSNPKMTRPLGRIDRDLLMSILSQARELGAREAGFYTTGDPFVHKGLQEFVGEAKRLGYEYTYISTNGALATPDRSKAVIDAGLDSIKFSINAGTRETYHAIHGQDDWDKVVANLGFISEYRKTLKRDLHLAITYVVVDQNQHEVEGFLKKFTPLVDDVYPFPANCQQGYMLENPQFLTVDSTAPPMKAPCYMVFSRAHITCEGYLTLCCTDYQNYLALADLKTMKLSKAWEDPLFVAMRERHLRNELEGILCWNCIHHQQTPIEPIVPEFASPLAFSQAAQINLEKQRSRFRTPNQIIELKST